MSHISSETAPSRMYDRSEVAEIIGVSAKTLREWERVGRGPDVIRFSPKVARYPASAVASFLGGRSARFGMDKIVLKNPIEIEGVPVTSIPIRPATEDDKRESRRGNVSKKRRGIALVRSVTGLSYAAILRLDVEDERAIERYLIEHGL